MSRSTRLPLSVLLAGLTCMVTSDGAETDPRLLQRPTVVKPACIDPRPYRLDSWASGVPDFVISLRPGLADSAREAERLAQKYKFSFIATDLQPQAYQIGVAWLEPEQVAAIRCETSVLDVGFDRRVVISTPHFVGPPLQRP